MSDKLEVPGEIVHLGWLPGTAPSPFTYPEEMYVLEWRYACRRPHHPLGHALIHRMDRTDEAVGMTAAALEAEMVAMLNDLWHRGRLLSCIRHELDRASVNP